MSFYVRKKLTITWLLKLKRIMNTEIRNYVNNIYKPNLWGGNCLLLISQPQKTRGFQLDVFVPIFIIVNQFIIWRKNNPLL